MFVDATEMYLRTLFELEEEDGVPPKRAELRARLAISRSAVAQHVARLVEEELATVNACKRVALTAAGREKATIVMRKHRLAERLLVDVVGLEWELAHLEASRWQHVLGERVERKLLDLVDDPTTSPYGNPVPGLHGLDPIRFAEAAECPRLIRLADAAQAGIGRVRLCGISEHVQRNTVLLAGMRAVGALPGCTLEIADAAEGTVRAATAGGEVVLDAMAARAVTAAVEDA